MTVICHAIYFKQSSASVKPDVTMDDPCDLTCWHSQVAMHGIGMMLRTETRRFEMDALVWAW